MGDKNVMIKKRSKIPLPTPKKDDFQKKENAGITTTAKKKKEVPDFKQMHKAWEAKFQKGKAQNKKPTTQVKPFHINNSNSSSTNHTTMKSIQRTSTKHVKEQFVVDHNARAAILDETHQTTGFKLFGTVSRLSNASMTDRALPTRRFTVDGNYQGRMSVVNRQQSTRKLNKNASPWARNNQHQIKRTNSPAGSKKQMPSVNTKMQQSNAIASGNSFDFKVDPNSLNNIMNCKGIDSTSGRLSTNAGPIRRATFAGRIRTNQFGQYQPRRVSIFRKEYVPQTKNNPFDQLLKKHLVQQNKLKSKWRRDLLNQQESTLPVLLTPRRFSTRKKTAAPPTPSSALKPNSSNIKACHVTWADVLDSNCQTTEKSQTPVPLDNSQPPKPKACNQLQFGAIIHTATKTHSLGTVQELTEQFQALSPSTPDPPPRYTTLSLANMIDAPYTTPIHKPYPMDIINDIPLPKKIVNSKNSSAEGFLQPKEHPQNCAETSSLETAQKLTERFHTLSPSTPGNLPHCSTFNNTNEAPYSTPLCNSHLLDISDFPLPQRRTKARTPHNKTLTKPKQSPQRRPLEDKTQLSINTASRIDHSSKRGLELESTRNVLITPKATKPILNSCNSVVKADAEVSSCFSTLSSLDGCSHKSAFQPFVSRATNPIATTLINGDDRHFYAILNGSHGATP